MLDREVGALIGDLRRRATQYKRDGDWDNALRCMKEVHDIWMTTTPGGTTAEGWTKYPLYLQQAGRYSEAITVFHQILAAANLIIERDLENSPPFIRRGYANHFRFVLYDKMRLAAKREKVTTDAERFEALAEEAKMAFESFQRVRDLHNARKATKMAKPIETE